MRTPSDTKILSLSPLALLAGAALLASPSHAPAVPFQAPAFAGTAGPTCDAGGPYDVECTGPATMVQLDASGSSDPTGGALTYFWELCVDNPRVSIDDQFIVNPTLTFDMAGTCFESCTLFLVVRDAENRRSVCTATVTVEDTTPPTITCPGDITVGASADTSPATTGTPTGVSDACNPSPAVTFTDDTSTPNLIVRTWKADDGCLSASCQQRITIEEPPAGIPGRFTGGGSVFMGSQRFTHGFELHCDLSPPNRLQINWSGNRFHLTSLDSATCSDDPSLDEEHPIAGFDTFVGSGRGLYNGAPGATIDFKFTDDGEPGKFVDLAEFTITDPSGGTIFVSGYLNRGNHQAHGN